MSINHLQYGFAVLQFCTHASILYVSFHHWHLSSAFYCFFQMLICVARFNGHVVFHDMNTQQLLGLLWRAIDGFRVMLLEPVLQ